MMYVSTFDGPIKIIDTDTNTVNPTSIALTPGFSLPGGMAYDPDHQRMYVIRQGISSSAASIVDIIDTTTNTRDTTHGPVTVGIQPAVGIAYDPVHETMYVCNFGSNDVSVIDTDTGTNPNIVIATVSGISSSRRIAYDPVNEEMCVTGSTGPSAEVDVIDTTSNPPALVSPPIPVNSGAVGIAYEPVNGRMYLANFASDSVTVMQTPGFEGTAIIDSANDGDGCNGADGGTTSSDEITFAFSGATSFECSINYSTFEPCARR